MTTDKTLTETALLILWICVPSLAMLLRIVSPFSRILFDPIFIHKLKLKRHEIRDHPNLSNLTSQTEMSVTQTWRLLTEEELEIFVTTILMMTKSIMMLIPVRILKAM